MPETKEFSDPVTSPSHRPTVSIVEDDTTLREELALLLQTHGFEVMTFRDANAFYRYMVSCPDTVLILDTSLNEEDGLSVCRYLRRCHPLMGIV